MLVLSRKESETIRIGDDITITIVRGGHNVRIGIDAPKGVVILRGELSDAHVTATAGTATESTTACRHSGADLDRFLAAMRHS